MVGGFFGTPLEASAALGAIALAKSSAAFTMNSVLIVDDEAVVRRMLTRVLERENHTVHEADGVATALKVLETVPISVMLCDRKMPGQNGDWLITQMHERFPATAVILITGDDSVPPRIALRPGVVGYFVKPFATGAICDAVRDAMIWHQVASRNGSPRTAGVLAD